MSATSRAAGLVLTFFCVAGPVAAAERPPEPPPLEVPEVPMDDPWQDLVRELEAFGSGLTPGLSGDLDAAAGMAALDEGKLVRAREIGERLLGADPSSYAGHCLVGLVQRRAEGNLPRAVFHLKRCLALFEQQHGEPGPDTPWYWHLLATDNLIELHQDMGRQVQALAYIDELDRYYEGDHRAYRGWPLVELGRYDEARALAAEILASSESSHDRTRAWITLCYLEGELLNFQESYEACREALRTDPDVSFDPVTLTNAAESARGVLRMDESERWLLQATEHFRRGTLSVPWMDLMNMYVDQGRAPEAVGAMREMFAWRARQPPDVDVQNWTYQDLSSAMLLLVAGHPVEASRLTRRALDQPDRVGRNSVDPVQLEAAGMLLDRAANLAAAELRAEEASYSGFWAGWRARLASWGHRLRAWRSGRRVIALMVHERVLLTRFAPYPPGFVRVPEWIEPDLVELLGSGVVESALERARALELVDGQHGYAAVFAAEIEASRTHRERALGLAEASLARLPRFEALLRARVAARAAQVAVEAGELERAAELYDLVFQLDPGAIRRLGLSVPAQLAGGGSPLARETLARLRRSPRLHRAEQGFKVTVEEREEQGAMACLLGWNDVVLACASVKPEPGEAPRDAARRLARSFHARAFAPRVDLSQSDLATLDGSTTVGGDDQGERLRFVLRDFRGEAAAPPAED